MAQATPRCVNHPAHNAVAKCKQCGKTLCSKCAKKMPGGVFCSDECYEKLGSMQQRVQKADEQKKNKSGLGGLIGKLVVVAIIAAILFYVFITKEVRSIGDLKDLITGFIP